MNPDMDRYDVLIRQCLKQWATRYLPPADGRARLLRAAAEVQPKHRIAVPLRAGKMRPFHSLELPAELFHWAIVYTLERGIAMKNLVS